MRLVSANAGNHENEKAEDLRERHLENAPARDEAEIIAGLCIDDAAEAQDDWSSKQRRDNRQRQRQFVADHLRAAAQSADERILVVR